MFSIFHIWLHFGLSGRQPDAATFQVWRIVSISANIIVFVFQWEKALSVAPGVSMKYWKKLMQRYSQTSEAAGHRQAFAARTAALPNLDYRRELRSCDLFASAVRVDINVAKTLSVI